MRIELTSRVKLKVGENSRRAGGGVRGVAVASEDVAHAIRVLKRALRALSPQISKLLPRGVDSRRTVISVVLVGEDFIRRMNREYRGKDRVTDVISFSYLEEMRSAARGNGEARVSGGEAETVGEIFLCPAVIAREARIKKCPVRDWLSYLAVHGCLHVFGYDHESDRDELEMECMAAKILGKTYPRRDEFDV